MPKIFGHDARFSASTIEACAAVLLLVAGCSDFVAPTALKSQWIAQNDLVPYRTLEASDFKSPIAVGRDAFEIEHSEAQICPLIVSRPAQVTTREVPSVTGGSIFVASLDEPILRSFEPHVPSHADPSSPFGLQRRPSRAPLRHPHPPARRPRPIRNFLQRERQRQARALPRRLEPFRATERLRSAWLLEWRRGGLRCQRYPCKVYLYEVYL